MQISNRRRLSIDPSEWPPGSVYVGRPGPLGNPFRVDRDDDRIEVIAKYEAWLREKIAQGDTAIVGMMRSLREDSKLVCWCAPKACHAEVVIKLWEELFRLGAATRCDNPSPKEVWTSGQ